MKQLLDTYPYSILAITFMVGAAVGALIGVLVVLTNLDALKPTKP